MPLIAISKAATINRPAPRKTSRTFIEQTSSHFILEDIKQLPLGNRYGEPIAIPNRRAQINTGVRKVQEVMPWADSF